MNQRTEFALRAVQTENFRALCREYGISARVGYKWKQRFLRHGMEGMADESRRPHSSPGSLGEEVVCRIVRLKQCHRHWGPRKIRQLYLRQWGQGPSESSFQRVLERAGLTQRRRVRRRAEGGRIASGRKAAAPNEAWTVDFKGWWYDLLDRCEPLTVRDEFSRYVLELRSLASANTASVMGCFERLFERHGLPGAIRSDNGPPFASPNGLLGLSRLSVWWLGLGIDLERGRPSCPQDNGAHERLHLDIARELQGAGQRERQAAFDLWRVEYNEERPHESLGMRRPAELYRPSARRWARAPTELCYGGMERRKVIAGGYIVFGGQRFWLSSALTGWHVGLRPRRDGNLDLYFASLLLGQLEPSSAAFLPTQTAGAQQQHPAAQKP